MNKYKYLTICNINMLTKYYLVHLSAQLSPLKQTKFKLPYYWRYIKVFSSDIRWYPVINEFFQKWDSLFLYGSSILYPDPDTFYGTVYGRKFISFVKVFPADWNYNRSLISFIILSFYACFSSTSCLTTEFICFRFINWRLTWRRSGWCIPFFLLARMYT